MTAFFLQLVVFLASAVIAWRSETVINLMGPSCRLVVRVAFWLLLIGAAALMIYITQGYRPTWPDVLLSTGLALLLASERRIRTFLRGRAPFLQERRVGP